MRGKKDGNVGTGKSTALLLTAYWARKDGWLVFYVPDCLHFSLSLSHAIDRPPVRFQTLIVSHSKSLPFNHSISVRLGQRGTSFSQHIAHWHVRSKRIGTAAAETLCGLRGRKTEKHRTEALCLHGSTRIQLPSRQTL